MLSLFKKEYKYLFSSLIGFVVIGVFLLLMGFYLFVNKDSSIFETGLASLQNFFDAAPWFFLLMIPALCMRSYADEFKSGTFEVLKSRPLTANQIVLGKFLAHLILVIFILVITLIYPISLYLLSNDQGLDWGGILGSYIGLFFLAAIFVAISLYCSSLTKDALVSMLLSVVLCLLLYYGFTAFSKLPFWGRLDYFIQSLGIDFHYQNLSRGLIDLWNIFYFSSLSLFFLWLTKKQITV